jgi:hypothetical protein
MSTLFNRRMLQTAVLQPAGFYGSASPERCDEQCTTNDEVGSRMNYVGSRFEGLSLGQGFQSIQMQDRWDPSLDEWDAGIADIVAHLTSANTTIAGLVAETSDPMTTIMSFELDVAAHSVQRALLALDILSHIAGLPAARQSSTDPPKNQQAKRNGHFLALGST